MGLQRENRTKWEKNIYIKNLAKLPISRVVCEISCLSWYEVYMIYSQLTGEPCICFQRHMTEGWWLPVQILDSPQLLVGTPSSTQRNVWWSAKHPSGRIENTDRQGSIKTFGFRFYLNGAIRISWPIRCASRLKNYHRKLNSEIFKIYLYENLRFRSSHESWCSEMATLLGQLGV